MDPTTIKESKSAWQIPVKHMEPQLELARCLQELRIDHKAKGFTEEIMMKEIERVSTTEKFGATIQERYRSLL